MLPRFESLTCHHVRERAPDLRERSGARRVASAPDDRAPGVVDFSIFPHLDAFPDNTMADAERWAAEIAGPAYVIDEQTAIQVGGDRVEVVSEGRWRQFEAGPAS